ncbi:hypothetical protein [Aurantimonas sp. Leaf443]|uniref:hypothetical protein n=1 Tax=Aurantimonas sp. Leaf443 TaxID=1736378 RepID=UPI0006FD0B7D|nr:hypothetical protein [Aurantimonas sp. Leaf443]KQT85396.1 hypothetical protein ASG48_09170 [Aurantimonas sp. Leaf443]
MTQSDERALSRHSANEKERTPQNGVLPRVSDTLVGTADAPDPDLHRHAAADADADTEAGAQPDEGGGITPLKRRD